MPLSARLAETRQSSAKRIARIALLRALESMDIDDDALARASRELGIDLPEAALNEAREALAGEHGKLIITLTEEWT